jgi:hypothetical protein
MLPRNFLDASITVQPNFSIRTVFTPTSVVAYQIQYEIVKKGKERGVGGGGDLKKALRTTFMFVV